LLFTLILTGCASRGSEFLGTWVNAQNPNDTFEISRNADEYLIVIRDNKIGAIYKDGALDVKGSLFSANLTYVKQTDAIVGPDSSASSSTGERNELGRVNPTCRHLILEASQRCLDTARPVSQIHFFQRSSHE
jgi:hypothetical protein